MIRALAMLLALCAVSGYSSAQDRLFATTGTGGAISTLVELDPATGAVIQTIGSTGYSINGLAFDTTTDTLYATTSGNDANFPSGLLTVDYETAAATPIGSGNAGPDDVVATLAADASGTLYSWAEPGVDSLVVWDKAAGTATLVGTSGMSTLRLSLAFASTGDLYYVNSDEMHIIDTSTGAPTAGPAIVGATGELHHGSVMPGTNLLYAVTALGSAVQTPIDILNLLTGEVEATLPDGPVGLHTLAWVPLAVVVDAGPVPALPLWALGLLASSLAGLGLLRARS